MEIGEFVLKIIVSAGVLSAFMFGVLWFMRKKGFIPYVNSGSEKLKVVSSVKLTPKSYLFTVKINDKKEIVVGVTDKTVSFICEVEK